MTLTVHPIPPSETLTPADEAGVAEAVRRAAAERSAVYPIGGGTAIGFAAVRMPNVAGGRNQSSLTLRVGQHNEAARLGESGYDDMRAPRDGPSVQDPNHGPGAHATVRLSTRRLDRPVDHAADDMTVTVEAGMTLAELGRLLAGENQRLPIDVCRPDRATVGGLAATNFYGPRRYAHGTMRDYVLGLRAVDGQGEVFAAGGRVVKNAAGYNLCRMMVGSRGTLGVITELTLMVRPIPEHAAVVVCDVEDLHEAEARLAALVTSQTRPVSIDLCAGRPRADCPLPGGLPEPAAARLLVGFEGGRPEVDWMIEQLGKAWRGAGIEQFVTSLGGKAAPLWQWLTEFPAEVRIHVCPSAVVATIATLLELDPDATVEAHAGDGAIRARFSAREPDEWTDSISHRVRPLVERAGGRMVVTSAPEGVALDRDVIWGPAGDGRRISRAIKEGFDPHGILNPGRYVFDE